MEFKYKAQADSRKLICFLQNAVTDLVNGEITEYQYKDRAKKELKKTLKELN